MRWIWHSQKNGCRGRSRRIGAARYEDGGGYTLGGAVEPSGTGRFGESHAAPWSPAPPDAALLAEIEAIIAELPTYGYRRVHALLRRQREQTGAPR